MIIVSALKFYKLIEEKVLTYLSLYLLQGLIYTTHNTYSARDSA